MTAQAPGVRTPHVVGRRFPTVADLRPAAGSPDWLLIGGVIALTLIGLVFMYSSSIATSQRLYGNTDHFLVRQLIGLGVDRSRSLASPCWTIGCGGEHRCC